MDQGQKNAAVAIQAVLIQQAKAERTEEIMEIIDEMKQKYESRREQYPKFKDEYEQAIDVCEAIELVIKTRLEASDG